MKPSFQKITLQLKSEIMMITKKYISPLIAISFGALILLAISVSISDISWNEGEEEFEEASKMEQIMDRFNQEWLMTHDPATGIVPRERLLDAYKISQQRRQEMSDKSFIIPIFWEERGPSNVGGRTRGLIFDANDASGRTVWAAGVAGGIWRCDDIDADPPTWTGINDFFSNMAISTIAQDPSNPNNMYFGTGENGFGNGDAVRGMGVWQSTDGGGTWAKMIPIFGASDPNINKVMVDNTGAVFAATTAGLFTFNVPMNIWNQVLGGGIVTTGTNVQDLEIAADGTMFAGINGSGIFSLPPAGTWGQLTAAPLPATGFSRIEIAVSPTNPAVLYAAFESGGNCLNVFSSPDGGNNWTTLTCPANLGGGNGQLWYDLIMAVDPNNINRVWAGGVGLFFSDDGGSTWTQASGVHSDHHALVYRPGNSDEMIFGNDGGVYWSTDASAADPTLTAKNNGYNVTQFYANAVHPDAGVDYILGGTQDNGTQRFECAGICDTDRPTGKDGGFCFIDQDNPDIQITSSQNREFNLSTDAGGTFNPLLASYGPAIFITPADYDDNSDILYFSDGRDTLGRLSDVGGTNTVTFEIITQFGNSRVSNILASPNTANRLFVGTTSGLLFQIDNADQNGAVTVTQLTTPFSTFVSSIDVENGNDLHLLATASAYGVNSIFESIDGGTTWNSVEGNLPDMPVRWCMFHPFDPNQALIATELGVWTTDDLDDGDTEWFPTNTYGLANVRVDMLQYRSSDNLLVAATHGRGMYSTDYFDLLDECATDMALGGNVTPGLYMVEDFITSDGTVAAGNSVIFHAGNSITLQENFRAEPGSYFVAAIQPCVAGPKPDKNDVDPEMNVAATDVSFASPSLKCFPNPVAYEMSISINLPQDSWYQLHVKNLQGRLITSLAPGTKALGVEEYFELNASQFEAGMYVLVLQTKDGVVSEKFVIAR